MKSLVKRSCLCQCRPGVPGGVRQARGNLDSPDSAFPRRLRLVPTFPVAPVFRRNARIMMTHARRMKYASQDAITRGERIKG